MTQNGRRKPETKGQRFARLYLENWRNFQRTDLELQRRVFLVGPNASGKSNLLDVFRFLHDIVSVGGGFQQAINKRGGVSSIRCLAARQNSDIVIRAELEGEGIEGAAGYELRFAQDKLRRPLSGHAALETELSLHPEVIRYVPQIFARIQRRTGRQIVLSIHSADLPPR